MARPQRILARVAAAALITTLLAPARVQATEAFADWSLGGTAVGIEPQSIGSHGTLPELNLFKSRHSILATFTVGMTLNSGFQFFGQWAGISPTGEDRSNPDAIVLYSLASDYYSFGIGYRVAKLGRWDIDARVHGGWIETNGDIRLLTDSLGDANAIDGSDKQIGGSLWASVPMNRHFSFGFQVGYTHARLSSFELESSSVDTPLDYSGFRVTIGVSAIVGRVDSGT